MNIISNNCLGGFYYKLNNIEPKNPFIWSWIGPDSFFNLVKDFYDIDLYKIDTHFESRTEDSDSFVCITLENGSKIDFIHHKYRKDINNPTKIAADLYSKNILRDCINKWYLRLDLMYESKEIPTFIYTMNPVKSDNTGWIKIMDKFVKLNNENVYIFTFDKFKEKYQSNLKTHIYTYPDNIMSMNNNDFCQNTINRIFKNA